MVAVVDKVEEDKMEEEGNNAEQLDEFDVEEVDYALKGFFSTLKMRQ